MGSCHEASKDFHELYALQVLKRLDKDMYGLLASCDRPDLIAPDKSLGVEVTTAFEAEKTHEIESLYSRLVSGTLRNPDGTKRRLRECGASLESDILQV